LVVDILDTHDVQSQVPELFHQSPELWVVPHRRHNVGVTVVTRLDLEVIDETEQQAAAVAAEADPVSPGRSPV